MLQDLTPRHVEILELAATGQSRKEIALALGISENTLKVHAARIFERLDAHNMTEAVAVWIERSG